MSFGTSLICYKGPKNKRTESDSGSNLNQWPFQLCLLYKPHSDGLFFPKKKLPTIFPQIPFVLLGGQIRLFFFSFAQDGGMAWFSQTDYLKSTAICHSSLDIGKEHRSLFLRKKEHNCVKLSFNHLSKEDIRWVTTKLQWNILLVI